MLALAVATVVVWLVAMRLGGEPTGAADSTKPGIVTSGFFAGFGRAAFTVERTGLVHKGCVLVADSVDRQEQGLMGARSLERYDGMVFRFTSDTDVAFFMKDTPMPLSIAWLDSAGRYLGATDMDPCLGQPSCPVFEPPGPYRVALEVPRGDLNRLGVGPGSRLTLGGDCAG